MLFFLCTFYLYPWFIMAFGECRDDLEVKRRKDIKDLREQLAQQQKVASQQGKKLGRRRSRSVTSEDRRGRRKSGKIL